MKELTFTIKSPEGFEFINDGSITESKSVAKNGISYTIFAYLKPIEEHPHADILLQCEQDKIDYPDFWWELLQVKEDDWHDVGHGFSVFGIELEYRQHPHRESIIEWHKCSDEDKRRWQIKVANVGVFKWTTCTISPTWNEFYEYRLSPRTCKVTLQNGTVLEYPAPCCEPLEIEQTYFVISLGDNEIKKTNWQGDNLDERWLSLKLIHLTQQAAEEHLAALQAINAQAAI